MLKESWGEAWLRTVRSGEARLGIHIPAAVSSGPAWKGGLVQGKGFMFMATLGTARRGPETNGEVRRGYHVPGLVRQGLVVYGVVWLAKVRLGMARNLCSRSRVDWNGEARMVW